MRTRLIRIIGGIRDVLSKGIASIYQVRRRFANFQSKMSSKASEKVEIDGLPLNVNSNNEISQEPESIAADFLPLTEEKRQIQTSTTTAEAAFSTFVASNHHPDIYIQNNRNVLYITVNHKCNSDASGASSVTDIGNQQKNINININNNSGVVRICEIGQFFDVRQENTNEEFVADTASEEDIRSGQTYLIPSLKHLKDGQSMSRVPQ